MSEAKGERIHLYTCRKTEEDKLSCPLCSYAAGRASRDGLRKAVVDMMLELLETAVDANAYDTVWKTGAKALEADGEGEK